MWKRKFESEHKEQIKAKGWFLKSTREDTLQPWWELLESVGNEFVLRNFDYFKMFQNIIKIYLIEELWCLLIYLGILKSFSIYTQN